MDEITQVRVTKSTMDAIGDSIRDMRNVETKYLPSEMPAAIRSIQPVLQEKTFTENGNYTPDTGYDGFNAVHVSVSGGGGASISTDFESINKLIPVMTSDTAPSGTASASSALLTAFAAYRAFDGLNTQSSMQGGWLAAASDYTPWIQYIFNDLNEFDYLQIRTANNSTTVTRSVTVEGLTASDVWENCLASGSSVLLEFRQNTYGENCLNYLIPLNGEQYRGIRISGNEQFYGGTNMFACTFDQIQILDIGGTFPGIGYYGVGLPANSFGSNGNLFTDLITGITYQKKNGGWAPI